MRNQLLIVLVALSFLAASPRRPAWVDADGDGHDTREELLVERCIAEQDAEGRITSAICLDGYTGEPIRSADPSNDIEVDHLIPWAWASSQAAWGKAGQRAFFNDPRNLVLTKASTNSGKGARLPDTWCPSLPAARRAMAVRYREVAAFYGLPLSPLVLEGLAAWDRGECRR